MIEQVLKDVRDAVQNNIAAEITAIEAVFAASDPLTLVAPKTYWIGERAEGAEAQQYPIVVIEAIRTSETYYQSAKEDQAHRIAVLLLVIDEDLERLAKRVYRTTRAIEVAFEKNVRTPGRVIIWRDLEVNWTALETVGSVSRKGSVIEVTCVEREDTFI